MWADPALPVEHDLRYAGKWLIYLRCRQVATSWGAISSAVNAGKLGTGAKISGHAAPAAQRRRAAKVLALRDLLEPSEPHVVCVYTRDWRETDDIQRVGAALHEIGAVVDTVLRYKSDAQTYAGMYAGAGPVSLFKMVPPYERVEVDAGLVRWAEHEPEARVVLRRMQKPRH